MPSLDALIQRLATSQRAQEPTGERVSGSIGINDLLVRKLRDGVHLGVRLALGQVRARAGRVRGRDDGGLGALGDDH